MFIHCVCQFGLLQWSTTDWKAYTQWNVEVWDQDASKMGSGEGPLRGFRLSSSQCIWHVSSSQCISHGERDLWGPFIIALILFVRAPPSLLNYLLNFWLPNTITPGFQHANFRGIEHLVHYSHIHRFFHIRTSHSYKVGWEAKVVHSKKIFTNEMKSWKPSLYSSNFPD
jgi:hypothetical protein